MMTKGFERPTRKETFLIAFILGGAVIGPITYAYSRLVYITAGQAATALVSVFTAIVGVIIIWYRIKISSREHLEAIETQKTILRHSLAYQRTQKVQENINIYKQKLEELENLIKNYGIDISKGRFDKIDINKLYEGEFVDFMATIDLTILNRIREFSLFLHEIIIGDVDDIEELLEGASMRATAICSDLSFMRRTHLVPFQKSGDTDTYV